MTKSGPFAKKIYFWENYARTTNNLEMSTERRCKDKQLKFRVRVEAET